MIFYAPDLDALSSHPFITPYRFALNSITIAVRKSVVHRSIHAIRRKKIMSRCLSRFSCFVAALFFLIPGVESLRRRRQARLNAGLCRHLHRQEEPGDLRPSARSSNRGAFRAGAGGQDGQPVMGHDSSQSQVPLRGRRNLPGQRAAGRGVCHRGGWDAQSAQPAVGRRRRAVPCDDDPTGKNAARCQLQHSGNIAYFLLLGCGRRHMLSAATQHRSASWRRPQAEAARAFHRPRPIRPFRALLRCGAGPRVRI